jgi:hypothetical protein
MKKRAAMEMSVGTLVTIVLLMAVLILGVVLIRSIFIGGQDAVSTINNQVIDEINNIFNDATAKLSIAPSDRTITLKRESEPAGFAFSVRNKATDDAYFAYDVTADDVSECGTDFTKETAESWMLAETGTFALGPGMKLDLPLLVKFNIPEDAPPCTMIVKLKVDDSSQDNLNVENVAGTYSSAQIFVTIK